MKRGPYKQAKIKSAAGICNECQVSFDYDWTHQRPRYCSDECRGNVLRRNMIKADMKHRVKNYHPPKSRDCVMCDKAYTPGGTRSDSRFCSLKCCMRGNQIERTYKLELVDYHAMVRLQAGVCAACKKAFGAATPHIDHDHDTGKVRGLVHNTCNTVLGFVKDDATKLENLAKYLRGE